MKIYLLIKPWDCSFSEAEVFRSKKEAEQFQKQGLEERKNGDRNNAEYWRVEEVGV